MSEENKREVCFNLAEGLVDNVHFLKKQLNSTLKENKRLREVVEKIVKCSTYEDFDLLPLDYLEDIINIAKEAICD